MSYFPKQCICVKEGIRETWRHYRVRFLSQLLIITDNSEMSFFPIMAKERKLIEKNTSEVLKKSEDKCKKKEAL